MLYWVAKISAKVNHFMKCKTLGLVFYNDDVRKKCDIICALYISINCNAH